MNVEKFREVIKQREETDDEWDYGVEQCWKKEIEILTEDIDSTIKFLQTACTADEYSWISEIIDDVAMETKSSELVEEYKKLMERFPEECEKYNIAGSIKNAEAVLEKEDIDEEENRKFS